MSNNKFKQPQNLNQPPRAQNDVEKFVQDFVEGAEKTTRSDTFPWEGANNTRRNMMKNMPLTEAEHEKIKFVSDRSGVPAARFMRDVVMAYVENEIKKYKK